MKKCVYLLMALLWACLLPAQPVAVKWGPELGRPKKTDLTAMVGADANSFFALRRGIGLFNSDEIYLEKYSKQTLRLEYIRPIKIQSVNGRRLVFEQAFVLKGNILVFLSYYDKEEDRNIAYVQKMSADDGSIMMQAKEVDFIPASRRRNAGSFDFILSRDSSKILVMHNDPFDKYANESFSYKVLDDKGEKIWSAALQLPYRDNAFKVSNYVVDNDGNVYMLASIEKNREDRERKKPLYRYALLSYNYRQQRLSEKPLELGDKFISDIAFDVEGGKLMIGGFYSNKSVGGVAGSFFISMYAKTQEVIASGTQDFTTEFLGEFMSQRRAEKHRELYNYRVDRLVTRADGGAYIVAEQYYMTVTTVYYARGGSSTTYNYYYNDIIVVNVNPDGSIAWTKKIPKYQYSTNDYGYYSSYAMNVANDKLYFIFNDNPKNLNPNSTKVRAGISRKMITVVASMDKAGTIKKEPLYGSSQGRIYTRPKISLRIGNKETLLYAIKRRTFKFGLVAYP